MAERAVTVRLRVADDFSVTVDRYSQKMTQAEQSTKRLDTSNQGVVNSLKGLDSQLQTLMGGVAFGIGINAVKNFAEGLYAAGQSAQRTELLFSSFEGRIGSTSVMLERLREVSRGAATDMALMQGANQLLNMGLVQNGEQLEQFIDIAATYSQALGTDMASSLEQFAMIMSNQSYLRLDALGIGAGEVRELAGRYRQAGMSSAEAFNAAFLEVASEKLPQMSAVADATVTELQRLQVSWDNFMTNMGERFAQGINGLVGLAVWAGPIIQSALWGTTNAQATLTADNIPMLGQLAQQFTPDDDFARAWYDMNAPTIAAAGINQNRDPNTFTDEELRSILGAQQGWTAEQNRAAADIAAQVLAEYQRSTALDVAGLPNIGGLTVDDYDEMEMQSYMLSAGVRQQQSADYAAARSPQWQTSMWGVRDSGMLGFGDLSGGFRVQANQRMGMQTDLANLYSQMSALQDSGAFTGDIQLFTDTDVQAASDLIEQIDEMYGRAQNSGLFTDAQLDTMASMSTYAHEMATSIQAGAEAFENMTMGQMFGQTEGGRRGEMTSAFLSDMEAGGATEDTLRAWEEQMGQWSGQETEMSIQWENTVRPMLQELGADLGYEAVQTWLAAYDAAAAEAAAAGNTTALPLDLITRSANLNMTGDFSGGGATSDYTVQAGDNLWDIARANGLTVEQLRSMNGLTANSVIHPGDDLSFGTSGFGNFSWGAGGAANAEAVQAENDRQAQQTAESFQTNLETAFTTAVDTLNGLLTTVAQETVRVPVEFIIQNAGGLLGQAIAALVNGTGGTVPGSTTTAGKSTKPGQGSGAIYTLVPQET